MRIAIISDIHANLEALTAVLESMENERVASVYCLGDCVGYGPDPDTCVDLLREKTEAIVMGNHDYAAVGLANTDYFNPVARQAIEWTRAQLKKENLNFLKTLPFTLEVGDILLTHASPKNPSVWDYVLSQQEALRQFKAFRQQICFIGHSHVPIVFNPSTYYTLNNTSTEQIVLEKGEQYIINVGSVGQPRDGDPRSCYVIYDMEKQTIDYMRIAYDVEKTSEKILKHGLPEFLAKRILTGQ